MEQREPQAPQTQDKGFTLVELLIVIVILGILASVTVFAVRGIADRGQDSACDADYKALQTAAEAAYAQTGSYPADETALVTAGFISSESSYYTYTGTGTAFSIAAVAAEGC